MEVNNRRPKLVFLVESCLALLVVSCIIIGFAGNGIRIEEFGLTYKSLTRTGLWYETQCSYRYGCTSISLKAKFDDGKIQEKEYYTEIVYWQIIVMLSLCFALSIGCFYILALFQAIDQRKLRPLLLVLCIAIGGFLLTMTGFQGVKQAIWHKHGIRTLYFPWSLFILAMAGVFAVILGVLNVVLAVRERHELCIQSNITWRPLPFLLEFVLMIISFIFQLAVHGGDGLTIDEHDIYKILEKGTDVVNTNITIREHFGVWYVNYYNGTEWRTMSRSQYNLLLNGDNEYGQDFGERIYIGFATVMSLVIVSTLAAVILYGVGLKNRTNDFMCKYHIRIYILTCTMVAGVIGLNLYASEALWQQLDGKEVALPNYTYYLAWGLMLLGLSAVIDLAVAGMNLVILLKQYKRNDYEHIQHVELSDTTRE